MTGDYGVDINAILDIAVFEATTTTGTPTDSACCIKDSNANWDCSACKPDMAAVCAAIDDQTIYPGATYGSVSTFSTALNEQGTPYAQQPTECSESMYAGCMTEIATTECPLDGGTPGGNIWSGAYLPAPAD